MSFKGKDNSNDIAVETVCQWASSTTYSVQVRSLGLSLYEERIAVHEKTAYGYGQTYYCVLQRLFAFQNEWVDTTSKVIITTIIPSTRTQ
jgi:hypothetical protein